VAEKNGRLTGTLALEGISLSLRLGVLPFEKIEARRVMLDLKWSGDLLCNGIPSVDYASVCTTLGNRLKPEYDYIEELAGDVLAILEKDWPGIWMVRVHKYLPHTDPSMERATVTLGE
jgi:dihydroneopterin aldolase